MASHVCGGHALVSDAVSDTFATTVRKGAHS